MKTEKLTIHDVNILPRLTYRRMGLNGGDFQDELAVAGSLPKKPVPPPSDDYVIKDSAAFTSQVAVPSGIGDQFVAHVRSSANAGFFIGVKPHVRVTDPIIIPYVVDSSSPAIVDDTVLVAGEGSNVTLVQTIHSAGTPAAARYYAGSTRVVAHPHSHVTIVQVQLLDDQAVSFIDCGVHAEEGATVKVVHVLIGGRRMFGGSKAFLAGDDASYELGTMFLGDNERVSEMNYMATHQGKRTHSDLVGRGALLDKAVKTFKGTIDFLPGAVGSKGAEEEFSLMFSPQVRNKSVPLILCGEEDVEGAHAVSTGRIDVDSLFYLMSRGLDETTARKLLVEAQFEPIIAMIPDENIRDEVSTVIATRLAAQ
ncbi:SufD family Fe-S cluster assembly protein [Parasphaerochaeta coccoides]|uniref:SufBD protein n=1 Tax=Parasphaerochaeta coccoides (strain ATCC BAA-1237 / DSM 17374 / SPN1) TaxID=760011 RepID=F4GLC8_PARC1|nr:SufD family Fe-S cluster assembly protein [Parasphaerochaeta coccoides]AEC02960.1 SufBD protein [Parasphaerochaeta coccoides DSM 17374]